MIGHSIKKMVTDGELFWKSTNSFVSTKSIGYNGSSSNVEIT